MNFLTHLECTRCGRPYDAGVLQTTCVDDGKPLYARYDLEAIGRAVTRESVGQRAPSLWRYREFLPVRDDQNIVSLGEGFTPLVRTKTLGSQVGLSNLWVKDEGQMPTGSFKARGLCVAVSRAVELGIKRVAMPSAGNAGGALAAYAARAEMEAYVFMPRDVPRANQVEVDVAGAHGFLVDGLITDCGALVRQGAEKMNWFDMSTLKEPYRVEGKKTMGYEVAEQFGWELPDVIIYPTGGGTGLVGMWKAFEELERVGWVKGRRPRMVCVQAEGCAPIVKALADGKNESRRSRRSWRWLRRGFEGVAVQAMADGKWQTRAVAAMVREASKGWPSGVVHAQGEGLERSFCISATVAAYLGSLARLWYSLGSCCSS